MIAASEVWWIAGIVTAVFGLVLVCSVIVGGILRSGQPEEWSDHSYTLTFLQSGPAIIEPSRPLTPEEEARLRASWERVVKGRPATCEKCGRPLEGSEPS